MSSKKCSLKVIDGNKVLSGTAAQLKHISNSGGWDRFLQNYTEEVIGDFSKNAAAEYTRRNSRPNLRKVK